MERKKNKEEKIKKWESDRLVYCSACKCYKRYENFSKNKRNPPLFFNAHCKQCQAAKRSKKRLADRRQKNFNFFKKIKQCKNEIRESSVSITAGYYVGGNKYAKIHKISRSWAMKLMDQGKITHVEIDGNRIAKIEGMPSNLEDGYYITPSQLAEIIKYKNIPSFFRRNILKNISSKIGKRILINVDDLFSLINQV